VNPTAAPSLTLRAGCSTDLLYARSEVGQDARHLRAKTLADAGRVRVGCKVVCNAVRQRRKASRVARVTANVSRRTWSAVNPSRRTVNTTAGRGTATELTAIERGEIGAERLGTNERGRRRTWKR
jgi:hypothetical protein